MNLKIYEVNNGVETYLWDQDWFFPYNNYLPNTSSGRGESASAVRYALDMPECTVFYLDDNRLPYPTAFSSYSKRMVNIYPYARKTIKCYLKGDSEHRWFMLTFGSLQITDTHSILSATHIRFGKDNFDSGSINYGSFITANVYYYGSEKYSAAGETFKFNAIGQNANGYELHYTYDPLTSGQGVYYHGSRSGATSNYNNKLATWLANYTPIIPDDDNPYDELVDDNNHGGNNTNFSEDSDTVTEDNLPTISAVGTGFATLFAPTRGQLRSLSEIFWNSNFFTAMQNLVENITDMFTSLAMVPFTVPTGGTVEVTWLGMAITEVYLTLAAQQFLEFNMGTINLDADDRIFTYDNALDYSPFSKLGIYLPFIGYQDLDIDECRGSTINLKYRIDILSGACVALIKINGSTIYQFTGNCLTQIPITNESIQSLISDAVNVGIAAANARTVGAASSADIAAAEGSDKMTDVQKRAHEAHARVSQTNADTHLQSATANAIMGLKPQYNKTGSVSAAAAMMSVRQPYLFLTTSRMAIPKYYEHYAGFPCNMTDTLGNFQGFTVVESIRLNDLVATTPEVEEIYELLKKGVII